MYQDEPGDDFDVWIRERAASLVVLSQGSATPRVQGSCRLSCRVSPVTRQELVRGVGTTSRQAQDDPSWSGQPSWACWPPTPEMNRPPDPEVPSHSVERQQFARPGPRRFGPHRLCVTTGRSCRASLDPAAGVNSVQPPANPAGSSGLRWASVSKSQVGSSRVK